MRISRKIALLVAVPLIAVVAFAAFVVTATVRQAGDAARLRSMVAVAAELGELSHHLQAERAAAAVLLFPDTEAGQQGEYRRQVAAADQSIARYRALRAELSEVPEGIAGLLTRIDQQLTVLPVLRSQVENGADVSMSAVAFQYRIAVADLLSYRDRIAQAESTSPAVADRIRAAALLSHAADYIGLQQTAALRALAAEALTPSAHQEITASRTGYTESLNSFTELAPPQWSAWLEAKISGPTVVAAQRLEDDVARVLPGQALTLDRGAWVATMNARGQLLREVEHRVDQELLTEVTDVRDTQVLWAIAEVLAVLATVGTAIVLAFWLGRPTIRGLRQLRDAAHAVAYQGLPGAVRALRARDTLGEATPEQFAERFGTALKTEGRDEIAEVADAFNVVSREAVRIAAEQAALHANMGAVFVSLARRGERLTGALIRELDGAERDEHDPDRLAKLFALDHLATRMGRNNNSLLVLGGEASARVRDFGASVTDLLRAAIGQVERYQRVELGVVDAGIVVTSRAVDHVAHLLSELIDNATAFSPPDTRVVVDARLLGDRVVVQILDQGLGIDPERRKLLNQRLTQPPEVDMGAARSMGLTVVGYLASWYAIGVQLRGRAPRGTIAEVTLPAALFSIQHDPAPTGPPPRRPQPPLAASRRPGPAPTGPRLSPPVPVPVPVSESATADLPAPTADLPIYSQVRNGWFTKHRDMETEAARRWQQAARVTRPAATAEPVQTGSGLPRRVPGERLSPGSMADDSVTPSKPAEVRDAVRVSAVMAAYARGVGASRQRRAARPLSPYPAAEQKEKP